jgi:hypothetical protein
MAEIWKDVPEFEGEYQVSNLGRVMSLERFDSIGRRWKARMKRLSGQQVTFYRDNRGTKYRLCRLVALMFVPNPDGLPEVTHIDRNEKNNVASNLMWIARPDIGKRTFNDGLAGGGSFGLHNDGEENPRAKLTNDDVLSIRERSFFGQKRLAEKYGVTQSMISHIVLRQSWKHI